MDFLKLTRNVLSLDEIMNLVSSEKCGAVSIFVGTTRDNFEDKEVVHLEYEAYDEMALKVMKELCTDIRNKWTDVHNIAIYHRLGVVPVLESSVVIAISSPHRVDSISAVKYCIENLKGKNIFSYFNTEDCDNMMIDPKLIQVTASNEEIEKRIQNFMERKREQINICNVQDFILSNTSSVGMSSEGSSCARVDAVLVKRNDSKGHLKVKKVKNEWGPQTKIEFVEHIAKPRSAKNAVEERLQNVEGHLNVPPPVSKDIYDRLKKIEDRILQLESLSPEYVSFWNKTSTSSGTETPSLDCSDTKKQSYKYTDEDILGKISALKRNNL